MLDVERLNTYRGPAHVLHNLSLSVGDRESVCLVGRNGAGKTTTIDSIMGLLPVKSGRIAFAGLAPVVVSRFIEAVKQIKGMGISLLIAESNLMTASRVADRLFAIDRGEIIFEGEPGRAFENPDVMKTIRG